MNQGNEQNQHIYFSTIFSFLLSKILVQLLPCKDKVKVISHLIYDEFIAETQSYNHEKMHMTGFYILNKVLKEEVEPFEWPSYTTDNARDFVFLS